MWADYGILNAGSNTVTWTRTGVQYDAGYMPSVAICTEGGIGTASVIEVHNGATGADQLTNTSGWYHVGRVAPVGNTAWGTVDLGHAAQYDVGSEVRSPRIACSGHEGYEVHQDNNNVTNGYGQTDAGLYQTKFSVQ